MQCAGRHLGPRLTFVAALLVFLPADARALVLHAGSTAPAVRPADTTVGRWGGTASCVPVADHMIVTTRHQGGGVGTVVEFAGEAYEVVELFLHGTADLRLARVVPTGAGGPLDAVDLYTTDLDPVWKDETDYNAVIGGYGKERGADLLASGVHYGYGWAPGTNDTLRWGENAIDGIGTATDATAGYTTRAVVADFDGPAAPFRLDAETAPAEYDSGGGWFVNLGNPAQPRWHLAGLTRGVTHDGESWFSQPSGDPPPDSMDAVRISAYAAWIDAVAHPHEWITDGNGHWFNDANWSTDAPDDTERWAVFGDVLSGPVTVTLDRQVEIGALRLESGASYRFADGLDDLHWLVFRSAEDVARIDVNPRNLPSLHGAHRVDTTIWLRSPLVVHQRSTGELTLAGSVTGNGRITKRGAGTLVLAADNDGLLSSEHVVEQGVLGAAHPNALGSGKVRLVGGNLTLRADGDALFPNRVEANADAHLRVEPRTAGSGGHLRVGELKVVGGLHVTVTGSDGTALAVDGWTRFSQGPGSVCTLETASADVRLDGPVQMTGGTLRKTGPGALRFAATDPADLDMWEDTELQVQNGTVRFDADPGAADRRHLSVAVDAGAAVEFAAGQHLAVLDVGGGTVTCLQDGGRTLVTGDLAFAETAGVPDGRLDLADNNLIVDYQPGAGPMAEIEAWVLAAYNGGAWDGAGITTGVAPADGRPTALAVADNADPLLGLANLEGQPLDADGSDVLVRFTWYGDVNLDGVADAADYAVMDQSWNGGSQSPAGGGEWRWAAGDVNYDRIVDAADYALIDQVWNNYQGQTLGGAPDAEAPATLDGLDDGTGTPSLLAAAEPLQPAGVVAPEPATLLLAAAGALAVLARRRSA